MDARVAEGDGAYGGQGRELVSDMVEEVVVTMSATAPFALARGPSDGRWCPRGGAVSPESGRVG
ncbi:hypothetical protein [Streptomyces sp. NPDC021096]|uniref:hypothetical protein n=1 Tax=Streptomyces sp. NPDC021096 TaxID=3154792 RepID=UPI003402C539